MSSIGERIREIRIQAGLTQTDFAARVGMSNSFLSELERGIKKAVGSDILISLKREFGTSADWILFGEHPLQKATTTEMNYSYDSGKGEASRSEVRKLRQENARLQGQIEAFREILAATKKG